MSKGFELGVVSLLGTNKVGTGLVSTPTAVTASGHTSLVAAPGAGKRIVVTGFFLSCKTAVDVYFTSATTRISPTLYAGANSTFVIQRLTHQPFECAANEALQINASAAGTSYIQVAYRTVDVS